MVPTCLPQFYHQEEWGKKEHLRVGTPEEGNIATFLEGGREEQIEKERLKG
jgi:hypothetical protein